MNNHFVADNEVRRVSNAVAAGTTDIESSIIDMQGFDSVTFVVPFGAITTGAETSVKVQQNSANSTSGMADLAGATVTVADDDDNKVVQIEVHRPSERYLRCVVDRGTQNAVVDGIFAVLGNAKKKPCTPGATLVAPVLVVSPAEA